MDFERETNSVEDILKSTREHYVSTLRSLNVPVTVPSYFLRARLKYGMYGSQLPVSQSGIIQKLNIWVRNADILMATIEDEIKVMNEQQREIALKDARDNASIMVQFCDDALAGIEIETKSIIKKAGVIDPGGKSE